MAATVRSQSALTCSSLPSGQGSRVGQQPANNRALAVIDVAADHDLHSLTGSRGRQRRRSRKG